MQRVASPALPTQEYATRAAEHRARLAPYLTPHLARRKARVKHPIHDFMFVYYSFRPSELLRWSPGLAAPWIDETGEGHQVTDAHLASHETLLDQTLELLQATAGRPANFGCFGLHEWAMVYRTTPEQIRHSGHRLRLGHAATDEFVESQRVNCSHFDAFRFFTPPARSLNLLQPGRNDRSAFEQPACLHGNMDLYKHAFRLAPLISADLIADCFELAWQIRITDMRAAPYDFTGLRHDPDGEEWTPIQIETVNGRAEYAATQRRHTTAAEPLRTRLIEECTALKGLLA